MEEKFPPSMDEALRAAVGRVMGRIPAGLFVMTAAHDGRMRAVVIRFVQRVSVEPPLVLVALPKGQGIVPLIHDSHAFAVSQIADDDRLVLRKLAASDGVDENALHGVEMTRRATGSPIPVRCQCFLDCELIRHADVDGDHDLYVGRILDADVLNKGKPPVHLRKDGFAY